MNETPSATPVAEPDYAARPRLAIKKDDGFLAYYFSAQLANWVARAARHTPITPNSLTAISLLLGLLAAWFYSRGDWKSLVIGAILHHVSFVLDCADGQLARVKGLKSQFGSWFDYHSDKIKDILLLLGLAWGVYAQTQHVWIIVLAFLIISLQFLRNISELNRNLFTWTTTGHGAQKNLSLQKPQSQLVTTLKNSMFFKLSDRVLLITLAALLNLATFGIIVYAVLALFFALGSGLLNYRIFKKYDHQSTAARRSLPEDQSTS